MVTEKLFLEVFLFLCFALQKNDKSENINMRQPLSFFLLFIFMTLGILLASLVLGPLASARRLPDSDQQGLIHQGGYITRNAWALGTAKGGLIV